ncbi:response regulator transcription factor [Catenulispora yoronensis]
MLGACYVWLTPEHYCGESSVADREYEIAALIGDEEYTALFREGACSTPFEVLGLLARCRFGGDPPGVIADGGPPRTVAAPVSPHRDGTDGRAAETHLTVRELEVARLVAEGLTNRQVARRLGISQWTAVNHLRQVMRKLECTSRVQVAAGSTRRPDRPKAAADGRRLTGAGPPPGRLIRPCARGPAMPSSDGTRRAEEARSPGVGSRAPCR